MYRFHTPDGVSDLLTEPCVAKRTVEKTIRKAFSTAGYNEVETPGIEFFDVYAAGGFVPQEKLFKMTDAQGRLLAMRYDGTIPVARLAATLYKDKKPPLRFSYLGNMYRYGPAGGGRQKEFTQAGVELMGVSGVMADAEIIALSIASARAIGLKELQISIGQVDFFRGLMEEWKIKDDGMREISKAIDQKDTVALERAATRYGLSEKDRKTLLMISDTSSEKDPIAAFRKRVNNPRSLLALDDLAFLVDMMNDYGYGKYISVDLGMLRSLDYYTGMIFKGFTYEVGFPVISGGRYDRVASTFGRDLAAVGFSLSIHLCMTALTRQKKIDKPKGIDTMIGFVNQPEVRAAAIRLTKKLRKKGLRVLLDCQGLDQAGLEAYAKAHAVDQTIFVNEDLYDDDEENDIC